MKTCFKGITNLYSAYANCYIYLEDKGTWRFSHEDDILVEANGEGEAFKIAVSFYRSRAALRKAFHKKVEYRDITVVERDIIKVLED